MRQAFVKVLIFGKDKASAEAAEKMVKSIIQEPEVGKVYDGVVKRIMDFGAFIEILPGKDGLCHISRLSRERVNTVEDVLSIGQEVKVKIIEIDRMGRVNLSYIDAIDPDGAQSGPPSDRDGDRGPRPPRRRPSGPGRGRARGPTARRKPRRGGPADRQRSISGTCLLAPQPRDSSATTPGFSHSRR